MPIDRTNTTIYSVYLPQQQQTFLLSIFQFIYFANYDQSSGDSNEFV